MFFYSKLVCSFTLLCLSFYGITIHAQPTNATFATLTATTGGNGDVDTPQQATNSNTTTSAELKASSLITSTNAWLQLGFASDVPTTTNGFPSTIYIRTNSTSNALLGGNVVITAYNNTGGLVTLTGGYKTFYTADANVFLAITPSAAVKYVRITITSPALLGVNSLKVFYAFYSSVASNSSNPYPFSSADCGKPNVTSKDYSDVILTNFNIDNPDYAIDDQISSKSSFVASGVALTSGHIKQTFFFKGKSNSADAVRIILSQSGSFAKLNLANSITIRALNGEQSVGTAQLITPLLDIDLLNLLGGNNNLVTFYFAPKESNGTSVIFDRVEIDLNIAGLKVALGGNGLNIHDVRRVPDQVSAPDLVACTNIGKITLSALSLQNGVSGIGSFNYAWYNDIRSGDLLKSDQSWLATGLTTPGQFYYYVEATKSSTDTGCLPSPRKKVTVSVLTPPNLPSVAITP